MNINTQALLVALGIGLAAGWLASLVMGGGGLIRYIVTGVIGSFVGSFLLQAAGVRLPIDNVIANQIATATIGAIVVILIARIVA